MTHVGDGFTDEIEEEPRPETIKDVLASLEALTAELVPVFELLVKRIERLEQRLAELDYDLRG